MIFFCFSGGTDPHWRHGERVPPRQFGHAESWRQHYPSHRYTNPDPVVYWAHDLLAELFYNRLCTFWHSKWFNWTGHSVASGWFCFCVGSFINVLSFHLTGLLWAATRASEEVDESHKVCGQDRTLSLAIFPEVKNNFARTERILF